MAVAARAVIKAISGVIFDLDDTLVLSTVDYAKFKGLVIERIAAEGEDPALYSLNETIVTIISRYEDRMRSAGLAETEVRRRISDLDRIMDRVELEKVGDTKAVFGAVNLLRGLKSRGVKIGVLTRGCEQYAVSALRAAGLLELVDALECRNSAAPPKPDPTAYLRLVGRLGVPKEETLFVGDHPIDAQCARNAGVPFVAVETGDVPKSSLKAAGCVAVFRDVGEMADWLLGMIAD